MKSLQPKLEQKKGNGDLFFHNISCHIRSRPGNASGCSMSSVLLRQLSTGSLLLYCTVNGKDCVTSYKFHCSYALLPPPLQQSPDGYKGGNVFKEGESCGKETVTSAGKCPHFFFF